MTDFSESFLAALACPRCDRSLEGTGESLRCDACRLDFPTLGGVPFLFAEPVAALAEWRQRAGFAIERLRQRGQRAAAALDASPASALTQQRLCAERDGYTAQANALESLLEPLLRSTQRLDYPTYLALRTRLPADQGLTTYLPNLFRDWAWGDAENDAALTLALDAIADAQDPFRRVLVLGAGAARLAHDLTLELEPELSIAIDFNPLLTLAAKTLTDGGTLSMTEFPLAPRRLDDHVVTHELRAAKTSPLRYVLGDVLRTPFAPGHFDLVVTPWLIDVVAESLPTFAARVNRLLAPRGHWLNLGSLAFRTPDPALNFSHEEALEIIGAGGFDTPAIIERELPYMRSAFSRHARQELLLASVARKTGDGAAVPRYRALPDWIVVGKAPVPATQSFQMQAASTRIHAFIMSLIDGRRSLHDMADIMEQRGLMPAPQAREAIRGFLIKMHDDAERYEAL